jgi:hypothetical protein
VLPEHIGERLIRQFLKGRHPVAPELLQLVIGVVVKGDQFAHDRPRLLRRNESLMAVARNGSETGNSHGLIAVSGGKTSGTIN